MFDASGAAAAALPETNVSAGYGASLSTAAQFNQALDTVSAAAPAAGGVQALAPGGLDAIRPAMQGVMNALEGVNGEATQLGQMASSAQSQGGRLSPGDMVMLSMRCQEFMFHCQLTSNIANRTSDGIQQLFKQQG